MDFETEYKIMSEGFKLLIEKSKSIPFAVIGIVNGKFNLKVFANKNELHKFQENTLWKDMSFAISRNDSNEICFGYHGHNVIAHGKILNNYAVFEHVDNDFWYKKTEPEAIDWSVLKKEKDDILGILKDRAG
jgi:hypothetical protein